MIPPRYNVIQEQLLTKWIYTVYGYFVSSPLLAVQLGHLWLRGRKLLSDQVLHQDLAHIEGSAAVNLTHSLFDPDRLATSQGSHLLDVRKVELFLARVVVGRKDILFPRLPQKPLHGHHASRQSLLSRRLFFKRFIYPAPIHQHCGSLSLPFQRRNDKISIIPIMQSRSYQHLLIVAEAASSVDTAIIEIFDRIGVYLWRKREGISDQAVFKSSDHFRFPFQPEDLPCAERECGDWDQSWSLLALFLGSQRKVHA